ncbi:peptidoglycan-recognition protein 1-like [Agrilus planipennis]|uniref:Peptidoglycan-recognition protein n=1 Tax=Agrilus planipennis TaxID=224129 RepID=A0A1W4XAW5_AGRPL|nr:peptidoglycan-recognition protein 1-like [Agrilus planipennis]
MKSFIIYLLVSLLQQQVALAGELCANLVSKKNWGARTPSQVDYALIPIKFVIVHHTVTTECNSDASCKETLQSIQNYHMDELDYYDIGYNFLIGGNGKVYEGTGWHKVGAHAVGYNSRSLGLAFIGDFRDKLPTSAQLTTAKDFLKCAVGLGELSEDYKLLGAKQVIATVSPGKKLYEEIKKWEHYTNKV